MMTAADVVTRSGEPTEAAEAAEATEAAPLEQLQGIVRRYCFSLTGSSWDGEDLAQEAWLKALPALQQDGHANPQALLFRIARNSWIDRKRRQRRLENMGQLHPFVAPGYAAGPEQSSSLEIESVFRSMLKHLTPLQRTVFLLRDVWDYSALETAERLHTTPGAVKAALHRARLLLSEVREEMLQGGPAEPQESEQAAMLVRLLAKAYQLGDVERLVLLAGSGSLEPAGAIALAGARLLQQPDRRTPKEARPIQAKQMVCMCAA